MRSFTSALVGADVATIVVSGSLAIAAIPDSTTKVITGCYKKISGELRVIDKAAKGACNVKTEVELGWNQQGVRGDQGIAGVSGSAGATGGQGPSGLPGKDANGAPVMYDATGAVVGSPVYPTTDVFWTGQYMLKYNLTTGKVVTADPLYLNADCTGDLGLIGGIAVIPGGASLENPSYFGKASITPTHDLAHVVVAVTATHHYGILNGFAGLTGVFDQIPGSGAPFDLVRISSAAFTYDASGVCTETNPAPAGGVLFLTGVNLLPISLVGIREFTGPIAPALAPMPG